FIQDREVHDDFEAVGCQHADGVVAFFGAFVPYRTHRVILCLDVYFLHIHEGVDKMKTAAQYVVLDITVKDLDAALAGADLHQGGGEKTDDRQEDAAQTQGYGVAVEGVSATAKHEADDEQDDPND